MNKSAEKNLEVAGTVKKIIDLQRLQNRAGDTSKYAGKIVKVLEILE